VIYCRLSIVTFFPYTTLFRSAAFVEAAVLRRHEQRGKQPAVLFDKMMSEIAVLQPLQLPQKVGRQTASDESVAQRLQFMRSDPRSEEHTSELQSPDHLVCSLL